MAYTPLFDTNAGTIAAGNFNIPNLAFNGNFAATAPSYSSLSAGLNGQQLDFSNQYTGSLLGNANNWLANNAGLVSAGAGLLTGGLNAWNGWNQNKLMEKQMSQQASQFNQQMQLQKQTMNRNLEDRQAARVASNPNAYASVKDYMEKYGVK